MASKYVFDLESADDVRRVLLYMWKQYREPRYESIIFIYTHKYIYIYVLYDVPIYAYHIYESVNIYYMSHNTFLMKAIRRRLCRRLIPRPDKGIAIKTELSFALYVCRTYGRIVDRVFMKGHFNVCTHRARNILIINYIWFGIW